MNDLLYQKLWSAGKEEAHPEDPSHDFGHIQRVLKNCEIIAEAEGGDLDILVPAALFHDVINHPKNHPLANKAADESAEWTASFLQTLPEYPQEKIPAVYDAIAKCSFNKGIVPDLWESKVLQDADGLESTGAISILRTFASTGSMQRPFYQEEDPFCEHREANPHNFALDLFYKRLLKRKDGMHTETGRKMADQRHTFLLTFLEQLKSEIKSA